MSRHLNNLTRLCTKLQRRYGNSDPLVLEIQREIDVIEARNNNRSAPYRDFIQAQSGARPNCRMGGQLAA